MAGASRSIAQDHRHRRLSFYLRQSNWTHSPLLLLLLLLVFQPPCHSPQAELALALTDWLLAAGAFPSGELNTSLARRRVILLLLLFLWITIQFTIFTKCCWLKLGSWGGVSDRVGIYHELYKTRCDGQKEWNGVEWSGQGLLTSLKLCLILLVFHKLKEDSIFNFSRFNCAATMERQIFFNTKKGEGFFSWNGKNKTVKVNECFSFLNPSFWGRKCLQTWTLTLTLFGFFFHSTVKTWTFLDWFHWGCLFHSNVRDYLNFTEIFI